MFVGPVGPPVTLTLGAIVSTVNERVAGEGSVFPAPSVATTVKVCAPSARPEYAFGDVHDAKPPASSLHWKVEPASVELKANDGEALFVSPAGPDVIVVS